jgi:MFS family permease
LTLLHILRRHFTVNSFHATAAKSAPTNIMAHKHDDDEPSSLRLGLLAGGTGAIPEQEQPPIPAAAPADLPTKFGLEHWVDFLILFANAPGALALLGCSILMAISLASTVGVFPDVLSDRYARLEYEYTGPPCASFVDDLDRPPACHLGADHAQAAAAWSTLGQNMLTLFCTPLVGSTSDTYGRRPMILWSVGLATVAPLVLVGMQQWDQWTPFWYYGACALIGFVSYLSMVFASLSDVIPEHYRASAYAIILAGFYGGYAVAPSLALIMNHFQVSVVASGLMIASFIGTYWFVPETLPVATVEMERNYPPQDQQHSSLLQHQPGCCLTSGTEQEIEEPPCDETDRVDLLLFATTTEERKTEWRMTSMLLQPLREISILTRHRILRLVALSSFMMSMVFSGDRNLVIYYIQDQLNVGDADLAKMFMIMGLSGTVIQAVLLQPLIQLLGERGLLVASFVAGTLCNVLYGAARTKETIYIAMVMEQLSRVNYPLLSSLASKSASAQEQGHVHGALSALNALGAAIGPLSMQLVYDQRRTTSSSGSGSSSSWSLLVQGPGTMFYFAAFIYVIGTVCVSLIQPKEQGNENGSETNYEEEEQENFYHLDAFHSCVKDDDMGEQSLVWHAAATDLEEPLLLLEPSKPSDSARK